MRFTDTFGKTCFGLGHSNQMNMVAHQAPGQVLQAESLALFGEKLDVGVSVVIREEDSHSSDTTLRDVMRDPWDYDTSNPGHTNSISWMI